MAVGGRYLNTEREKWFARKVSNKLKRTSLSSLVWGLSFLLSSPSPCSGEGSRFPLNVFSFLGFAVLTFLIVFFFLLFGRVNLLFGYFRFQFTAKRCNWLVSSWKQLAVPSVAKLTWLDFILSHHINISFSFSAAVSAVSAFFNFPLESIIIYVRIELRQLCVWLIFENMQETRARERRARLSNIWGKIEKLIKWERERGRGNEERGRGNGEWGTRNGSRVEAPFVGARCLCLNYWPNGIKFSSIYWS